MGEIFIDKRGAAFRMTPQHQLVRPLEFRSNTCVVPTQSDYEARLKNQGNIKAQLLDDYPEISDTKDTLYKTDGKYGASSYGKEK